MESDQHDDVILSVAYNDLSDVWNIFGQALEEGVSHLQQVAIKSKVGAVSRVKNIPIKVVSSTHDKSISRLYHHRKSPMSWFRLPFVELVVFSCQDYDEYKRNFRLQLRAMADVESRLPTDPIPIFVYVQPPTLDEPKGPSRVVDAATKELGDKSFPGNTVVHVAKNMFGIQELVESIRAALFVSVEARCSAYHHEASAIMATQSVDDASLSELYLIKDSAAALYEAVGMHQDAWIEYNELEAMIEEMFSRMVAHASTSDHDESKNIQIIPNEQGYGEASQMWHRWHLHRSLISSSTTQTINVKNHHQGRVFIDVVVMPCIVSNMVRLLMKDLKRVEALNTCRQFIDKHRLILQHYESNEQCPSLLSATWTFAACIGSLLLTCSGEMQAGEKFFSKALEDMEKGTSDSNDIYRVTQDALQSLDKPGKSHTFFCTAGHVLMMARDMLEGLGKSHGRAPPAFDPSAKDLVDLLKTGHLHSAPRTPNTLGSRSKLTPQNSLGPEDSPRFGYLPSQSNELVRLAHENTLMSMDNIDLSNLEHQSPVSEESDGKDIAARNISLHAREISDSGNIADAIFTTKSQGYSQTDGNPENSSLLQSEASITMDETPQHLDMCMQMVHVESVPAEQLAWKPQYWRLREGMKSVSVFVDMWKTITTSCRDFYVRGGYQRNACILNIELGDAAYIGRDFSTAVEIYEDTYVNFKDTNWKHLLESVSLKLACAQVQSNDIGILGTCNLLLQLACEKSRGTGQEESIRVFAEIFVDATRLSGVAPSSAQLGETESLVMNPSMVLDVDKSIGMIIYEIDGVPSYVGDRQNCIHAHVGDSVSMKVEIINNSEITMSLDRPSIYLVALQEMSNIEHSSVVAHSTPIAMTPILQNNGLNSPVISPRSPYEEDWKPRIISHWQDIDEVKGTCTTDGCVDIQPGKNELEFYVNPIRSGLYKIKHIQSRVNGVNVQILPVSNGDGCAGQRILLSVEPPAPRMCVKAITTGNTALISGENQWLGVEISVPRETVSEAHVSIEWPSRDNGSLDKSKNGSMEADHIIRPLHSQAMIKSLLADCDTMFAPAETNSDIIGSGPLSMYSLRLDNASKLHAAIWWRVNVKQTDSVVEDVRIYSYQKNRLRNTSPTKVQTALPRRQTKQVLTAVEMPISLHYSDHCSRVASASANIYIDQPFQIQTDAFEIRKGVIMVSLKITSSMERQVQIKSASLQCQKGFQLEGDHKGASNIVPCTLDPLSSLYISFMLRLEDDLLENRAVAQAMVYRTGKLLPSIASIEYCIDEDVDDGSMLETYIMDDNHNLEGSSALYSVYDGSLGPSQNDYRHLLSTGGLDEAEEKYVYHHKIALQLSSIDKDAYNVFVSIRMLGPFTANIGCPTTLCWQLERVGSGSHSKDFSAISYEILADKNCWSKGSGGQGRILLGLQNGSVATIETQWTPTSLGTLEVPTLNLHDVYYQEVRETGVKKNLIIVKS